MLTACATNVASKGQCLQECAKTFTLCQTECTNTCDECKKENIIAAAHGYCQFIRELKVQNGLITRQLQSYRDPLKCRQTTCDCVADRAICQNACSN